MVMSQKGIDVRQTGTALVFRSFLQTAAGALLGTGTTTLSLIELQSDGTIKSYDFSDNTFKTTALTTATLALTHRPSNNGATTIGFWTAAITTVSGFTVGGIYLVIVNNGAASPTDQMREFQYGGAEGDLAVTAGATGVAYLQGNAVQFVGQTITAAAGVTLPSSVASPTNITAGVITTVTNLTNLPSIPADWLTAAGIAASALNGKGDWALAGSVPSWYAAPVDVSANVTAIKAKTDNLPTDPADASDIATSFGTVNATLDDLPTNVELAAALGIADDAVLAQVALVKAKTDNLPSDPADASDIAAAFSTVSVTLGTIAGYIDTEVGAIKAKTDLIPASPAAVGSAMTLTSGERDAIASAVFKLDLSTLTGEASRSLLNAVRKLRNKWSISGTTLTVFAEDDATPAYTQSLTATPGAAPITGIS